MQSPWSSPHHSTCPCQARSQQVAHSPQQPIAGCRPFAQEALVQAQPARVAHLALSARCQMNAAMRGEYSCALQRQQLGPVLAVDKWTLLLRRTRTFSSESNGERFKPHCGFQAARTDTLSSSQTLSRLLLLQFFSRRSAGLLVLEQVWRALG